MIRALFQTVLDCAAGYSAKGGDMMDRREEALKAAKKVIETWLAEDIVGTPFEATKLDVQFGGRQAQYGPVPWIRIYSHSHSPRTTEGFYLVWLFGATGQSAYLSLNQGTSEWRGNKMRPVSDSSTLSAEAMTARWRLSSIGAFYAIRGTSIVDLRADAVKVGSESRKRVRNYELANIVAIPYGSSALPLDDDLRNDIRMMLPLLAELYRVDFGPTQAVGPSASQGKGQGRLDQATRVAIERHAVELATKHYESLNWAVEDVGKFRSYDLHCVRDGEELHVECKGTTESGQEVFLTRGEVNHCRSYPACSLIVVSQIEIDKSDPANPRALGGVVRILDPWAIEDDCLTPIQYAYRLP
jgi:hypothetical protein